MKREKLEMESRYGNLTPISIMRDAETKEVSYRAAKAAQKDNAGDYFPGLEVDDFLKRAWYERN